MKPPHTDTRVVVTLTLESQPSEHPVALWIMEGDFTDKILTALH